MSARLFLVMAVLMVMAAGCGWNDAVDSRAATAGLPDTRQLIQEHDWVLDRADSSLTVDDDNPVTLSVVDDVVSGTAPCNAYRGDFSLGGDDSVEITNLALTLRDCGDPTMEAETEFIAALEAVDSADVDEDDNERLVLNGDDVRLVFRSYDADELLTSTWTIVNVATGDTIASVLDGTEPTLTFTDDGDVAMETGCNTATSTWELDGHALSIDPVGITQMSCDSPEGVMDQEAALVAALEAADRIEIAPGTLTILDEDGSIMLVAVRE
jgi:heat shock protein HslJ